ncbi:MAG: asparagine synthase [Osedax symbiont Rs2]|nr:MAG: asparagine synthase [Osedax symbiont Rs2]
MCGFVVSATANTYYLKNKIGRDTLSRGLDSYISENFNYGDITLNFEFSHLFISSPEISQPLHNKLKIMVMIGETYNYQELADRLHINSTKLNDVSIFFKHIERYGLRETVKLTNGMYSGFLFDKTTGQCEIFTDHVGKKPLLIWNSGAGWHVATGIDINHIDEGTTKIQVLTPGVSSFDIKTGAVSNTYCHQPPINKKISLFETIENAISLRIPKKHPFAIALSGGLDSSIIAYLVETRLCKRARYYVVGESYPDSVLELLNHLDICHSRVVLIQPPSKTNLLSLITETCRITKSFNPSIISNGLATLLLAQAVHRDGIRVMLTGEGADEFFCGYQGMYNGHNNPALMREGLVQDLHFTELRRLDLISSNYSIEARCPFLDHRVTQIALSLDVKYLCNISTNTGKTILRDIFKHLLPHSIINAPKEPFDITSGLQKLVIDQLHKISKSERAALRFIFEETFGYSAIFHHQYFSHYPTFDKMIDRRELKYKHMEVS